MLCPAEKRPEVFQLSESFRGRIVDIQIDNVMVEVGGTEAKVEAFIALMRQYGILELARTGRIALRQAQVPLQPGDHRHRAGGDDGDQRARDLADRCGHPAPRHQDADDQQADQHAGVVGRDQLHRQFDDIAPGRTLRAAAEQHVHLLQGDRDADTGKHGVHHHR